MFQKLRFKQVLIKSEQVDNKLIKYPDVFTSLNVYYKNTFFLHSQGHSSMYNLKCSKLSQISGIDVLSKSSSEVSEWNKIIQISNKVIPETPDISFKSTSPYCSQNLFDFIKPQNFFDFKTIIQSLAIKSSCSTPQISEFLTESQSNLEETISNFNKEINCSHNINQSVQHFQILSINSNNSILINTALDKFNLIENEIVQDEVNILSYKCESDRFNRKHEEQLIKISTVDSNATTNFSYEKQINDLKTDSYISQCKINKSNLNEFIDSNLNFNVNYFLNKITSVKNIIIGDRQNFSSKKQTSISQNDSDATLFEVDKSNLNEIMGSSLNLSIIQLTNEITFVKNINTDDTNAKLNPQKKTSDLLINVNAKVSGTIKSNLNEITDFSLNFNITQFPNEFTPIKNINIDDIKLELTTQKQVSDLQNDNYVTKFGISKSNLSIVINSSFKCNIIHSSDEIAAVKNVHISDLRQKNLFKNDIEVHKGDYNYKEQNIISQKFSNNQQYNKKCIRDNITPTLRTNISMGSVQKLDLLSQNMPEEVMMNYIHNNLSKSAILSQKTKNLSLQLTKQESFYNIETLSIEVHENEFIENYCSKHKSQLFTNVISQNIENKCNEFYSESIDLSLPLNEEVEFMLLPSSILLSNYCCEYDKAYTKKDLKPILCRNYYSNKINDSLKEHFDKIITPEKSLEEFFKISQNIFEEFQIDLHKKVNNILLTLEND